MTCAALAAPRAADLAPPRMPLQRKCACEETGESCARCAQKKTVLQRFGSGDMRGAAAPEQILDVIGSPGQPLPMAARLEMEGRFGEDFSKVRVHADARAAASANAVNANAYTVGSHVVMGAGSPDFATPAGRRLLGHELAHVVQQSRAAAPAGVDADPALERDAREAGEAVAANRPAAVRGASGLGLARDARSDDGGAVMYEVRFPDGVKRLTKEEFERYKAATIHNLRLDLNRVVAHAELGKTSQTDMLKEYHGGVESLSDVWHKPKSLIGIGADIWGHTSPPFIGMWDHPKHIAEGGFQALDRGDIAQAARILERANQEYKSAMAQWNDYRAKTIGGAESLQSDLETVRDVSFAIALAAGAAIAAPVVASGVTALGATGAGATALTAGGTALVTGAGGALLGGGSTAGASYAVNGKVNWKDTKKDAAKFGKQGAVSGLTAGLGQALNGAGAASQLARPIAQAAARRCLTEAGINVAGEVTSATLDHFVPTTTPEDEQTAKSKELLPGPVRAALAGCIGGALGVPAGKLRSGAATAADKAIGAGIAFGDAKLQGKSNKEAGIAAAQSTLVSHLVGIGKRGTDEAAARRAAAKAQAEPHRDQSKDAPKTSPHNGELTSATKPPAPAPKPEATVDPSHALAQKETANGHHAVVTPKGVGVCSPGPCPVIHIEYAEELARHPELKAANDSIQAKRLTNPQEAAAEAAGLVKALEDLRAWRKSPEPELDHAFAGLEGPSIVKKGGRSYVEANEQLGTAQKRIPKAQKTKVDLDDLVATPEDLQSKYPQRAALARARNVIGRRISDNPKLRAIWDAAAAHALAKTGPLSQANYKKAYYAARDEFWQNVRASHDANVRGAFEGAGFNFEEGKAPLLAVKDPSKVGLEERRISLDHNIEKGYGDGWRLALDPTNLTFELQTPNSNREATQARHPELRPGTSE